MNVGHVLLLSIVDVVIMIDHAVRRRGCILWGTSGLLRLELDGKIKF